LFRDAWKYTLNDVITEQERKGLYRAKLEIVQNDKLDSTIVTGSSRRSKWIYYLPTSEFA
jgi:hypothetical protein